MKTIISIKNAKNREKLVMITAYDALFASLFDNKVDMILVGDSLSMSFGGHQDTLCATLETIIYHTKAVLSGAKNTLVIADMPFGTCVNKKMALKNAIKLYQKTGVHAVKIEGGRNRAKLIKELTKNSIAVMGHIGLMPQFIRQDGSYIIKGKNETDIQKLIDDAKSIEDAGAFSVTLEGVTNEAATRVTKSVNIPVIGIGAGVNTDGQVLVWSDMLGLFKQFKPKFVKQYLDGAGLVEKAVSEYADEVKNGKFPSAEFTY